MHKLLLIGLFAVAASKIIAEEIGFVNPVEDDLFDGGLSQAALGSESDGLSRYIINGEEAKPNRWPWMTRLGGCGGSLISSRWVLTAAHCSERREVLFGAHNLTKRDSEEPKRLRVRQKRFIIHQNYSRSTLHNDIAVIELEEEVKFTDAIRPVTLPSYTDAKDDMAGKPVTMIGWGRTNQSNWRASPVLRQATTPLLANAECAKIHNGENGRVKLIHSMVCTSHKERKAGCHGDSGSPVNWHKNGEKWVQVGIASFVLPGYCDREGGVPTGHTRVTSFLKWISDQTGIKIED